VEGGMDFNRGAPIEPSTVEMLYWFTAAPLQPQRFVYDARTHQANHDLLAGLLTEITQRDQDVFPLTNDERRCRFCVYRSLCKRGLTAGEFESLDVDDETYDPYFELDFDSLSEVPF